MRIATECQRSTPTDYFPILAGIQPPELCQHGATFSQAYRSLMDPKHLLYQFMVGLTADHKERLRSRHPFVLAARKLLNKLFKLSVRTAQQINYKWNVKYSEDQSKDPVHGHLNGSTQTCLGST